MTDQNRLTPAIALSTAKGGEKLSVLLPNGRTVRLIANNDIISTDVLVIGDRVISNDISRVVNTRTTELFQSSSSPNQEEEFPWAYLFEINDFAAYKNAEGVEVNYTDESWNLDPKDGVYKPFGNGGGDFKTVEEIEEFYNRNNLDGDPRLNRSLLQQSNAINISRLVGRGSDYFQYEGVSSARSLRPFAGGDGVQFGDSLGVVYGANERYRSISYVYRQVYPERSYWIEEKLNTDEYTRTWETYINPYTTYPRKIKYQSVSVSGNSQGEIGRTYIQESRTYTNDRRYTYYRLITFRLLPDGTELVSFGSIVNSNTQRETLKEWARKAFAALNNSGYEQITFTIPNKNFHRQIFTGEQILNGVATREYQLNSGNLPSNIVLEDETLIFPYDKNRDIILYESNLYLIPEVSKRNPGVKSIYIQVKNNPKTLIHQIPTFELYQGFVSPLPKNQLEIVLRCGKQYREEPQAIAPWSQVRVYRVNSSGKIILESPSVFNNAKTDANQTSSPEEIIVSEDNWQKEWLSTYENYQTVFFTIGTIQGDYNFIDGDLIKRTGKMTSLNTSYRSYYSDRNTEYYKAIEHTGVTRFLSEYSSYGTRTKNGFVHLDPRDLVDANVELDYSFTLTTNFFPSLNYSIFSGLVNGNQTQKRYFLLKESEYRNGTFIPGITIEKVTQFPKLDLKDEIAQGVVIPKQITRSDWSTEWSVEPGVETDLLRFAIIAIAYLG